MSPYNLPARSGTFVIKQESDIYPTQEPDMPCGCCSVLPRLWPGKRFTLTKETLVKAWNPKRNDQAYAQILSVIKLIGECDVVRPIVADARYPTAEYPQSSLVPATRVIQDLTYASVENGDVEITIVYIDPGVTGALSVSDDGKAITVTLGHDGTNVTSTADEIKTAVDGHAGASALVTVTVTGTGTTVQQAQAVVSLSLEWEYQGVEFTTDPDENPLDATKSIRFWVADGSKGSDFAFKISNKDVAKLRFDLHLAQLQDDGTWEEFYVKTVSAVDSGQWAQDDAGDPIFVETMLKDQVVRCKIASNVDMIDIPEISTWLPFTQGVEGSAPSAAEWQAAFDILKVGSAIQFFTAGISDTTVISYMGVEAKALNKEVSFDIGLFLSVDAAITAWEAYTACDKLYPYFNPLYIDDPSGIGKMWIGHSGHAAALASRAYSAAELRSAEAIAGVPWGGIGIYNNTRLYHDSLTDSQLDSLAVSKINVCVPAPKNSGYPVCFNDQWTMAKVESDDQFRHVQSTHSLISREAKDWFDLKAHRSTKEIEESIELFIDYILSPMEKAGMLVPIESKDYPAFEVSYAEDSANVSVFLISIKFSVARSNRQILVTTKTRR